MEEDKILTDFVDNINRFFQNYNEKPFSPEKKGNSIRDVVIRNKSGMQLFLENLKYLNNFLSFSTYNVDFDGISKIERLSDDQLRIYSKKIFSNDKEQSILFEPEQMHFIQEDLDFSLTTVAIKTKKEGPGLEVFSSKLDSDELYIDGGHVVMIYPYCSHYAEPEKKIRLMRDYFKLNLDKENLLYIPDYYEPRAFSETCFEEERNPSMQKTKKISLEKHLVEFFGEDFFVLPVPDKKLIQIMLSPNEEETNIKKAINKLHELYPARMIYDGKKPSCQVIEIADI